MTDNAPESDRSIEHAIRDLRVAEHEWLPLKRSALQAHSAWVKAAALRDDAGNRCLELRDEVQKMLRQMGPR